MGSDTSHILGIDPTQVQDLALVEHHEVHTGPFLKSIKVPSLQCVNCTTKFGVIGKFPEGALNATVYVAIKYVPVPILTSEEHHTPLTTGLHFDIDLLTTALSVGPFSQFLIPRVLHLSNPCLSSLESRTAQDSAKCFAKIQVDDVSCSSLIHQHCNLIAEGHRIFQG
ncbi:hypothetical protein WISP_132987 [Willisornis vidua]|uniref:Uncharacterized protein n=1 Tax=Willisornis vidua TaxID=1566151 RepID=A0ABQ9CQ85_9PASS|nr:hypothetical protein WISP_132987 [Willisornis vidua]